MSKLTVWVLLFSKDGASDIRQGIVLGEGHGGSLHVQLCSWVDGRPNEKILVSPQERLRARYYFKQETFDREAARYFKLMLKKLEARAT